MDPGNWIDQPGTKHRAGAAPRQPPGPAWTVAGVPVTRAWAGTPAGSPYDCPMSERVKVAVIGVGNNVSALVQGIALSRTTGSLDGVRRPEIDGIGVGDVDLKVWQFSYVGRRTHVKDDRRPAGSGNGICHRGAES